MGGDSGLGSRDADARSPDLMLGVYAYDGRLIGYLVIEVMSAEGCWGGLTTAGLDLGAAVVLARRSAASLALAGLRRGAHHCLCLAPAGLRPEEHVKRRTEFIEALGPLARKGLLRVVFDERGGGAVEPALAQRAAAASAAAVAMGELSRLGIPLHGASIALHDPTPLAMHTFELLRGRGLRPLDPTGSTLAAASDVLVVGTPLWSEPGARAGALRARVVVPLGATNLPAEARRKLAARGVGLIPDSVPVAGMLAALDLRSKGLTEHEALEQSAATVLARAEALLGHPR